MLANGVMAAVEIMAMRWRWQPSLTYQLQLSQRNHNGLISAEAHPAGYRNPQCNQKAASNEIGAGGSYLSIAESWHGQLAASAN